MKRWTTVLSVLAQAFWQFCNVAFVQSLSSLTLLLRSKNFLWLYWTGWKIRTALHDVHDDHGWVGESTVDVWQCCVPLSLSDTSSAMPTTRVWKVEEEKELSKVSQSMRNESLLYLISIHKVFDFMHMNLIICIGLYAYALHNMHIHLIICICIFLIAYSFDNLRMYLLICIRVFEFAYALYAMSQVHNPTDTWKASLQYWGSGLTQGW